MRRTLTTAGTALLAAASLPLAACSDDGGSAGQSSDVLLDEPFDTDDDGWTGAFQTIGGGQLVWELPPGQTDARAADSLIAVEDEITSSVTTTTFTADGAAAVGIDCATRDVEGEADFYQLVVSRDGVEIRKRSFGDVPGIVLAEAPAPTLVDGHEVRLRATCSSNDEGYALALAIDGQTVLETIDTADPLGAGAPGLLAEAAPPGVGQDGAVVRFDDFNVRRP